MTVRIDPLGDQFAGHHARTRVARNCCWIDVIRDAEEWKSKAFDRAYDARRVGNVLRLTVTALLGGAIRSCVITFLRPFPSGTATEAIESVLAAGLEEFKVAEVSDIINLSSGLDLHLIDNETA